MGRANESDFGPHSLRGGALGLCLALGPCLLGPVPAAAQTVELETYSGPEQTQPVFPNYPRGALRTLREGWVRVHFMVGTDGRPYEIDVTDSMGSAAFEDAAVRALEETLFEPARFNGTPIDAGYALKYTFDFDGNPGARPRFLATFRAARKAIARSNAVSCSSGSPHLRA